ncbi:AP-3 complex subunit delta-like [Capsicum annuum]|nr:AP-3 complex subunit delta-like [Capsicum annuum]
MTKIPHCQKGEEIENQLVDIVMRVKDARPQLVRVGRDLLIDPALLGNPFVRRILSAAAWVSGEYVRFSKIPSELVEAVLQPRTSLLPSSIKAVYIQSAFKVLTFCVHYCISTKGVISSASQGVEDLMHGRVQENPQFVGIEPVAECDTDDGGLNPRMLHRHVRDVSVESLRICPLSGSHDVEILERSRNVLGLVELIREELLGYLVKREEDNDKGQRKTHEMIKLIAEAFSEELGPVSASSQERVPVPEGMVLNQNLADLDAICGDLGLHIPTSFSLGRSISSEKVDSQKKEMVYDDYPPANDLKTGNNADDEADDLVKLTEQSLFPKKKENQANQAKPRPVVVSVVKRDDGNGPFIPAKKVESNDDLISGAVLRRSKRHSRGKEKKHRSTAKDRDEHEEGDKQKLLIVLAIGEVVFLHLV